jgi:hypothetical protein
MMELLIAACNGALQFQRVTREAAPPKLHLRDFTLEGHLVSGLPTWFTTRATRGAPALFRLSLSAARAQDWLDARPFRKGVVEFG